MVELHEPPNLDELSEDEQVREVYAWAGLALYYAQVVEHGLVNLVFFARLTDPTLPEEFKSADEFFEAQFRRVMGQTVRAVRKHVDVDDSLDSRLAEALRLRNFIAHEFFRERIELFMYQEGRRLMLAELGQTVRHLKDLDEELETLVVALGAPYGVSAARIAEMMNHMPASARPAT
ncbi:MAG: hypothetical protein JWL83_2671 [Actinomycetia bacterium]|nr:hypothetical protein [Actinomycetes bacterium]